MMSQKECFWAGGLLFDGACALFSYLAVLHSNAVRFRSAMYLDRCRTMRVQIVSMRLTTCWVWSWKNKKKMAHNWNVPFQCTRIPAKKICMEPFEWRCITAPVHKSPTEVFYRRNVQLSQILFKIFELWVW